MSSLSELVRLVGTLSEQIDHSREKSQVVALQMKEAKAIADDVGARWVADAMTDLRARLQAVDLLLVQANLGTGEIRRQRRNCGSPNLRTCLPTRTRRSTPGPRRQRCRCSSTGRGGGNGTGA